MTYISSHSLEKPPSHRNMPVLNVPIAPIRYQAVAMELAVHFDGQYVEMHILSDTGKTISVVCNNDSIFSIKRHIEQIGRLCPEISTWKVSKDKENRGDGETSPA